jgi:amino acid transporter
MTGIEAVSNGVSAFQDPAVKHARPTLTVIVLILGCLVAVISWLCPVYGVHAMDETQPGYQSVPSQLTGAIVGRGVTYFIAIGSLLAVLCRSANRALSIFRRLCRLVGPGWLSAARAFAIPAGGWFIRLAYGG